MAETGSFRNPRVPAAGSPSEVHTSEFYEPRLRLDRLRVHHIDLARRFLEAAEGKLFSIDLMVAAVMNRSYALVDGFLDAFDRWNLVVGGPILRMQIDSLTRLAYMANAPQADEIAAYLVAGGEFRKRQDAEGQLLTDTRLIELAKEAHPWIKPVYKATSGWVHLSPEHIVATWHGESRGDGESAYKALLGSIPTRPARIPISMLEELIAAMIKATEEIFGYAEIWESRKGLPPGEMRDISKG